MEEFIFDDDVDEVGAEIEAACPKCKADTAHVVISKYEEEIRRVQCNPCGDVHPYRKPRGDEEELPEPTPKKKPPKAKPTWDQVMAKNKKPPKQYMLGEYFKELEILSHPKFGVGYVTENIGDDKIEVTFQHDKRVLVHNRKGLQTAFVAEVVNSTPAPQKKAPKSSAKEKEAPPKEGKERRGGALKSTKAAKPAIPKPKSEKTKESGRLPTQTKGAVRPVAKHPDSKPSDKKAERRPAAQSVKAKGKQAPKSVKQARAAAPVRSKIGSKTAAKKVKKDH